MFKKPIWRRVFIGLGWVFSLAGLITLMSFLEIKKDGAICKDVKVYIPGSQYFIDQQQVDNILDVKSKALIGNKIDDINIHALETRLKANPFIEFAKVYRDMDDVIRVEIRQRQPILRILNKYDQDYYVDQHGLKIPLSDNFTAKVVVANGFIDEFFSNKVDSLHTDIAKDLFKVADFIRKDSLWSAQVVQIYVNDHHEMELIPRVGSQRILLGNADSLDIKFRNLLAFYKQALPIVGQDAYKAINVKYANQVIGIKNELVVKKDTVKTKKPVLKAKPDTASIIDNTVINNITPQTKN
jgi:cell division protein FtsQ